jgi:hypothetical protein
MTTIQLQIPDQNALDAFNSLITNSLYPVPTHRLAVGQTSIGRNALGPYFVTRTSTDTCEPSTDQLNTWSGAITVVSLQTALNQKWVSIQPPS